ncbi:hypothetical protein HDU85_004034 [Gaertneriomyces sp. JEL0708]|nr:hypothetical protein HDU85_004034 [Gaertneriomyces sp. JEL0708]
MTDGPTTPPNNKRKYNEIADNAESRDFFASFGMSADNPAVKCRTPRKPKEVCAGFELTSGASCSKLVHKRSHQTDYILCRAHDNVRCRFALFVAAQMAPRFRDCEAVLVRKAAAALMRNIYDGNRPRKHGRFYLAVRILEDADEECIKVGMMQGHEDDDIERRLEEQETECQAVFDHNMVSAYFKDVGDYDFPMNILLSPQQYTFACSCKKSHQEYFTKSRYTVRVATEFWRWVQEHPVRMLKEASGLFPQL